METISQRHLCVNDPSSNCPPVGCFQFLIFKDDPKHPWFTSHPVSYARMLSDLHFVKDQLVSLLSRRGLGSYTCSFYPSHRPFGIRRIDVRSFSVLEVR